MRNPDILRRIGCVPTPRAEGGHDFLLPLTRGELAEINAALGPGQAIEAVVTADGPALRFQPEVGLTPDILALANLRGVTSENAQGAGI